MNSSVTVLIVLGVVWAVRAALARIGGWANRGIFPWIVIVAASGVTGFAVTLLQMRAGTGASLDAGMAQVKQLPLMGVLLDAEPGAEAKLRGLIGDVVNASSQENASQAQAKARALIVELRMKYASPALAKAEDAYITRVWDNATDLINYLHTASVAQCKQFFITGIENTNDLDEKGKELFLAEMHSLELAFLNGRKRSVLQSTTSDEEMPEVLVAMGFSVKDVEAMGNPGAFSDRVLCELGVKMYTGAKLLPAAQKTPFMRRTLTLG